ncbi:MAG: dihydropteroate synthase [Proteobacteria bacterium]|nr:dihydropteroate synthase [Pseudomonadota bacterium]
MIIIGEKINGTRKQVAKAIQERDETFIRELAIKQSEAGAHYLDINAGTPPDREPADMVWLIQTVHSVTNVNLCLDSTNPEALKAGIQQLKDKPIMLNSLSGEKNRINGVLPLACEHNTELIVLALDDKGIPNTGEERLAIIRSLVEMTRNGGLPDRNLYIDPLITTIATDTQSGPKAFDTMRKIKDEFPDVHLTAGLSNISFGMPSRPLINRAFAALAIAAGLDSAIINPEDKELRGMVKAVEMVLGMDKHCLNYIRAHRSGQI